MRYTTVHSTEWTYPDVYEYATGSNSVSLTAARGGRACVQVLLFDAPSAAKAKLAVTGAAAGFEAEWFELRAVPVEKDVNELRGKPEHDIITRPAPFRVYDCLASFRGTLSAEQGTAGIYLSLVIPETAEPGEYGGELEIELENERVSIPLSVKVTAAVVPKETLKMIIGYNQSVVAKFHHAEGAELAKLDDEYLDALRRGRQNMLYIGGVKSLGRQDGHYRFDFTALGENVRHYMAHGFEYFNMSSVGGRKSWHEPTILVNGMDAMSYEAYCWLADYLPALSSYLDEQGWAERFYIGVADEPNEANATEYRALCGLVHRLAPKLRLLDALSYVPVYGALNVWVPLNAEYQKHREEFDRLRGEGDETWFYVCCGPRGEKYINRFMDYPLLSTRYQFWGSYKFNLPGYLHWASNCYQPGQDPFLQNCPEHHNCDSTCILPAGDTHILYPGSDGPWISIRLEAQRESAEEYELLRVLAQTNKPLADEICGECFTSFNEVEYDPNKFEAARAKLLEAF